MLFSWAQFCRKSLHFRNHYGTTSLVLGVTGGGLKNKRFGPSASSAMP